MRSGVNWQPLTPALASIRASLLETALYTVANHRLVWNERYHCCPQTHDNPCFLGPPLSPKRKPSLREPVTHPKSQDELGVRVFGGPGPLSSDSKLDIPACK